MVDQTMFVNNLIKRMHFSFDNKFYLESIACSYAIIENRTKRICEHLDKSASSLSLYSKTEYIYNSIKNNSLESDIKKRKLIGYLKYRINNTKLLKIYLSKEYKNVCKDIDNTSLENQLISFRTQRNEFTHSMYKYDSNNPRLTNFDDFASLAKKGIYVATELCSIASGMKRKKSKLEKKTI